MLQSISIHNYALIDSLTIEFEQGFNIITGETGAGKSIILGALGLIIGQRADTSVLRDQSNKCIIEGIFSVKGYGLKAFFKAQDLDYADSTIIRREITIAGTSRAFINDTPVTVAVLRKLGLRLVDIHSQHQNLELGNNHFQLKLVDLVAGNAKLLEEYDVCYTNFRKKQIELKDLEEQAAQSRADSDYYEFQFKQLDEAHLKENEQEDLENELETLNHAEEIQLSFGRLNHELEGEELNILSQMKDLVAQMNKVKVYFPEAEEIYNRLHSSYLELKDIATEALSIAEKIENNPERQELVNQRLDMIYSLQQKHRVGSISELLNIYNDLDLKIQQVSSFDDQIEQLKNEMLTIEQQMTVLADKLRVSRKAVAGKIENTVIRVLNELGMPNANFSIDFKELNTFQAYGQDQVRFLFSANKSSLLEDISKVASGGEMSRLMLAVKTLVTDAKALPTIVFDEIDTGISGEVAVKMGYIIKRLSENVQVINITHLPQIAAKGQHHFQVYKYDEGEHTFTSIRRLNEQERIIELAKMLSGENYSEKALETAKELLD